MLQQIRFSNDIFAYNPLPYLATKNEMEFKNGTVNSNVPCT